MTLGDTYVKIEREFDENGNTACERYYGPDGQKIARNAGYDEIRREFNEENRAKRIEYYLQDAMLGAVEREYDGNGNITYEKYFGPDGAPAVTEKGYCAIRREYSDQKQVIYEAWFDTNDQPMPVNGKGYFAIRGRRKPGPHRLLWPGGRACPLQRRICFCPAGI